MKVTWLSLGDIASVLLQDTKITRPPAARPVLLPMWQGSLLTLSRLDGSPSPWPALQALSSLLIYSGLADTRPELSLPPLSKALWLCLPSSLPLPEPQPPGTLCSIVWPAVPWSDVTLWTVAPESHPSVRTKKTHLGKGDSGNTASWLFLSARISNCPMVITWGQ